MNVPNRFKIRPGLRALVLLAASGAVCLFSGREFVSLHRPDLILPSPGLTAKNHLSAYFPDLAGTPADTDVYVYGGGEAGGHILVLGGTHPNEPAGFISALILAENIRAPKGKIVVIPQVNRSAFSHNDPFEGNPQSFPIETPGGTRRFRFGSRLTNPVHQWPDPTLFINSAGQKLAGTECRNLNRCYPGRKSGYLTEKLAYAVMRVIEQEAIDLAIDLHEAAPEYPVINAIVFHENSAELAATAAMNLQLEGLEFRLEASPPALRGLSHREWGDSTGTMAVLLETANASHGRLRGRPSTGLILEGRDKNYVKAAELGLLFVPYDSDGIPLRHRVSRHLAAFTALLDAFNELHPDKAVHVESCPDPRDVDTRGIGPFLNPPGTAAARAGRENLPEPLSLR